MTPAFGQADLTNCDREPIHVPGSIQPHGVLLAVEPETLRVVQAGGDAVAVFGRAAQGLTVGELLGQAAEAAVGRWAARPGAEERPVQVTTHRTAAEELAVLAHRSGDLLVLEMEHAGDGAAPDLPRVHAMISRLQKRQGLTDFCQGAAEEIRALTGFERVMVYRFLEDDSGRVVAEARDEALGSFMDLHFPASDVPKQARELYRRNWLRLIPDAGYTPAPIEPAAAASGEPLDLSLSVLRSVSPLHLEYLRNMGVAASMSVSIVQGERLWGLIACHHRTPHHVPHGVRLVCELFAQTFSLQLEAKDQGRDYEYRLRLRNTHQQLMAALFRSGDPAEALIRQKPDLLEYIEADGVALWLDGRFEVLGRTPDEAQTRALVNWLNETNNAGVFVTDRLGELFEPAKAYADAASGLLALSVTRTPRDYVLWFRQEMTQTVRWAGDPHKPVTEAADGLRLHPRKSFETWAELVRGRSRPWKDVEGEGAEMLRLSLLEIVLQRLEEVARERSESKDRQDLLLAELNHRVKNTLATVQAVVRQSGSQDDGVGDYVLRLEQRLRSMARAHDLLTQSRWESADLRELIRGELEPYVASQDRVLAMHGSDVELKPKAGLALSLAVHELATNAAKYGAMAVPGGRVDVNWSVREAPGAGRPIFELVWKESRGPSVKAPMRRGFGSDVIETSLAFEVDGESRLEFEPDGLRCVISAPAEEVVSGVGRNAPAEHQPIAGEEPEGAADQPRRILVVEDSALLAMNVEMVLEELGWTPIGPAARLGKALELAEQAEIDGAVLDVDLAGTASYPVAEALQRLGVPFFFTTGYDAQTQMPASFRDTPTLAKPYADAALRRMLIDVFGSAASDESRKPVGSTP